MLSSSSCLTWFSLRRISFAINVSLNIKFSSRNFPYVKLFLSPGLYSVDFCNLSRSLFLTLHSSILVCFFITPRLLLSTFGTPLAEVKEAVTTAETPSPGDVRRKRVLGGPRSRNWHFERARLAWAVIKRRGEGRRKRERERAWEGRKEREKEKESGRESLREKRRRWERFTPARSANRIVRSKWTFASSE